MALDKPIEYTWHAKTKMLIKGYVGSMVEAVIADPDDDGKPGDAPDSIVLQKKLNGFTLYVCYIEFADYYRIITVFDEDEVQDE